MVKVRLVAVWLVTGRIRFGLFRSKGHSAEFEFGHDLVYIIDVDSHASISSWFSLILLVCDMSI